MARRIVHVEVGVAGCDAEVWVNDFPIYRVGPPELPFVAWPVHEFLVGGGNRLKLVVNPGPTPSVSQTGTSRRSAPGARAYARLVGYEDGDIPGQGDGEEHAQVNWRAPGEDEIDFPVILDDLADLGSRFGGWAWERAEVLTLDESTRAEAQRIIKRVHKAMEDREAPPLIKLLRTPFEEVARAYQESVDDAIESFRQDVEVPRPNEAWNVRPLVDDEYDLRLIADGRLIDCVDVHWRPIVGVASCHEHDPDDLFPLPLRLGRIHGRLQVPR